MSQRGTDSSQNLKDLPPQVSKTTIKAERPEVTETNKPSKLCQ